MEKIPLHEDKFMRGMIAGFIAGLVKDIPAVIVHLLHSDVYPTYWDYSGMIGLGTLPKKTSEIIIAICIQLTFTMAVGIGMVHAISKIRSHHYLIMGGFFGVGAWFFIRAIMWIFAVRGFAQPQSFAFIINSTTSLGFGILVAYIDRVLQRVKE